MNRQVFYCCAVFAVSLSLGAATVAQEATTTSPSFTIVDPDAPVATVTFLSPLLEGEETVKGKALVELIVGAPIYPPIEGLPDEVWKDKPCSACHEWTKDRLCEQSQFYTVPEGAAGLQKQHPLGVEFKAHLRDWALGGCQ